MFGDAALAARIANAMLDHGVYVTAFSFPVVPREQARIRVQLSAAHTEADIDEAVRALDRKSTRLNSSHVAISYAVFCLKKKKEDKLTNDVLPCRHTSS